MENRTTIQIEKETLVILKKMKLSDRETYDEVFHRLIGVYLEQGSLRENIRRVLDGDEI